MRPDKQSTSFTFHRNIFSTSSTNSNSSTASKAYNCRRKLQDKFNEVEDKTTGENGTKKEKLGDRSVLSTISLNDTRRLIREGADKISKSFNTFRTSVGNFSQRFKLPTKRRQILEEGPMTPGCATPQTFSREILGRTPTKLYSPFSIESPYKPITIDVIVDKENIRPPYLNRK